MLTFLSQTEVALSPPFLDSTILFSLTSDYEKNLKNELWLCHKNMNLTMNELYEMTVADRKTYIAIHNKETEKENAKYKMKK